MPYDGHHVDSEQVGKLRNVDRFALQLEKVHHRESHHDVKIALRQLAEEVKVSFQVPSVEHADEQVRLSTFVSHAIEHLDRDLLVLRDRVQAIEPGNVDDLDPLPKEVELARDSLDRDAGVVADLLMRAGERVEERRLAGVRVADNGDQRRSRRAGTFPQFGQGLLDDLHFDARRLSTPQAKPVAAQIDLDRIAKRSDLNHAELCAFHQTHFLQAFDVGRVGGDPEHSGAHAFSDL